MKRCTILAAALILAATGGSIANAGLVLADRFDQYADQAAFRAVWTPIGSVAPTSADLSTTQSSSPLKSVEVDGEPDSAQGGVNGKQRNQRNFTETGNPSSTNRIVWSFNFYDTAPTAAPFRQYANLQDGAANLTNMVVSMGLNNNQSATASGGQYYMARILGYTVPTTPDPDGGSAESVGGASAYFKLNDFGAPHRSAGWHNLKVIISSNDNLSVDYDFYVDGVLAERVRNVGTAATIRSYDHIRIGSGLTNTNHSAYFDDMRLKTISGPIPEPTSLALAGLSMLGLFFAGRRRAS